MEKHPLTLLTETDRAAAVVWRLIESGLRESCVLRAEGREVEALVILQQRLPALIREWSAGCGRSTESCRSALRELFTRAQAQVAAAVLTRRLVLSSLQADLPLRGTLPGVHLNQRIPLTDINGMLDALHAAECAEIFRRRFALSSTATPFLGAA